MTKIFLILLVATSVLTGWIMQPKPAQPMNIVFIFADDMSPTLGCYGDSVAPTPTIDRLAREGVLFENAFARPRPAPPRGRLC